MNLDVRRQQWQRRQQHSKKNSVFSIGLIVCVRYSRRMFFVSIDFFLLYLSSLPRRANSNLYWMSLLFSIFFLPIYDSRMPMALRINCIYIYNMFGIPLLTLHFDFCFAHCVRVRVCVCALHVCVLSLNQALLGLYNTHNTMYIFFLSVKKGRKRAKK